MNRKLTLALLVVAMTAWSCGDDGEGPSDPGNGGGNSTFTATIDGAAWTSDAGMIQLTGPASPTPEGTLAISGYQASNGRGVQLLLSFISGPTSQPLGVNVGTNPGGVGSVLVAGNTWLTPLSGAAGIVNITARTDKRIAGTFDFTALTQAPGTVPDIRAVTGGSFDITVDGGLPPLPTGVGSTATAMIEGLDWVGSTVVGGNTGAGLFEITAINTAYTVVISTNVPLSVGTYDIATDATIQVSRMTTPDVWVATGEMAGWIDITTFDSDRLVATFAADLPRVGGGANLSISDGTINVFLEN
jgi:hypothetical protein